LFAKEKSIWEIYMKEFSAKAVQGMVLLLLLVVSTSAKTDFKKPKGDERAVNVQDLAPHPKKSSLYNEFWTYHIYLDNDVQLVFNLSRANLTSLKGKVCGADLSVANWKAPGQEKGENYVLAREYPVKNFKWDAAKPRLEVHPKIYFEGAVQDGHKIHLETKKKGVRYFMDLTFENVSPSLANGNGEYRLDDETLGMVIHTPYAKVRGRVGVKDDTLEVSGKAFMDHSWATDTGPSVVGKGFRYISFFKGGVEAAYVMVPREEDLDHHVIGYGIRRENGETTMLHPERIFVGETKKKGDVKKWIRTMDLSYDKKSASMTYKAYYQKYSILSEFGGLKKWTAKKFMGGEMIFFRGWGDADGNSLFYDNYYVVD
jgi:hypothetical protein